jgi:hypothetical protein
VSWIADQRSTPGTAVSNIAFTVSDVETSATLLTVTAASSNTTLLPVSGITFGGSGANRTASLDSVSGQTGRATITLTVSDGTNTSSCAFVLDVVSGNTLPGIRDPNSTQLRSIPGYKRLKMLQAVQTGLRALQDEFPGKFVQIGFWPITDDENASYGGVTAADWIRQQLLAEFNGIIVPEWASSWKTSPPSATARAWTRIPPRP